MSILDRLDKILANVAARADLSGRTPRIDYVHLLALSAAAVVHLSAAHATIGVPAGWYGTVRGDTIQLATFTLPRHDDEVASAAAGAHAFHRSDALLVLFGYGLRGFFRPLDGHPVIRARDLRRSVEPWLRGRAFARRTFDVGGRDYDLWVDFGEAHPSASVLARVNRVLARLRFDM